MECNKDEAIRAKELAEKRMSSKDYVGARKLITKAQKLYPSIEHVIQMLAVCEVHCFSERKVHGLDPDWYSILQIEQTADEASIKKQFRKLALQLHPDKNKFPGAEAAFKLISEAQRVLSDQATRKTFDLRRMANVRAGPFGLHKQSQPQSTRNDDPSKQPGMYSNPASTDTSPRFSTMNPQQQKQHQTQPNGQQTFWTACPFCSSKFQSYRDKMKKAVRCKSCNEPFIAFELKNQGTPSGVNNRSSPRKKEGLRHNGQKMAPENIQGNRGSTVPVSQPPTKIGRVSVVGGKPKPKGKEDVNVRTEAGAEGIGTSAEHKLSSTKNRKRRRNPELEEDPVRCNTGRSPNMEEDGDHKTRQSSGINSGRVTRSTSQSIRNNYPSKQPEMYSIPANTGTTPRFTSMSPVQQKQHQNQPVFASGQQAFWTACPYCSSRWQSNRDKMKKAIRCQSCKKPFIAYELKNQGTPSGVNNRSSPRKEEGLKHNGQKMAPENVQGNRGSKVPVSQPLTKIGRASVVGGEPKPKGKEDVNVRTAGAEGIGTSAEHKLSSTKNRKRRRNPELEEDCVRCNTGRSPNMEENGDHKTRQSSGINSGRVTRSTSRSIRNNYPSKQPEMYSNPANTGTTPRFTSMSPVQQKQQQNQPMFASGQQAFWTACPFCNSRWQSNRDKMKKAIRCQSCKKPFIAFELKNQRTPSGVNNRSSPRKKEGLSHNGQKMAPKNIQGSCGSTLPVSQPPTKSGRDSVVDGAPNLKAKKDMNFCSDAGSEGKGTSSEHKLSGTKDRKRGRKTVLEEEPRSFTGRSSNVEARQNSGMNSGRVTRSTSRRKDDVSFKQNVIDGNGIASRSRQRNTTVYEPGDKVEKYERRIPVEESTPGGNAENCKKNGEEVAADNDNYAGPGAVVVEVEVPDPDFYDFDRDRIEEGFASGQIWAIFDDLDGMPRFYARIKKVYSPFKVDIIWLDSVAWNPGETVLRSGLPVACGKFKHGKTDTTEDIYIFSHRIVWKKGARNSYMIYPRKGETWALYKNWNIKWRSDPINHREFNYELVVVLSDYTHKSGILVARLVKLKGSACLFMPTKNNGMAFFQIPSNEILRFSHRVTSFRTNGKEREDVPEGYFELDPASLPSNLEEVSDFIDVKADGKIDGSLKFVSEEKPRMPRKRKNPDEKSPLIGSSPCRTRSSSRMSNEYYKNANERNY